MIRIAYNSAWVIFCMIQIAWTWNRGLWGFSVLYVVMGAFWIALLIHSVNRRFPT